jgi:hypothetical protein
MPGSAYIDRSRANLRGLALLGFVAPFADQVKPQLDQIAAQLQQAQASIDANNQTILQLQQSQPGIDLSAEGAQQMQAQNNLETWRHDFQVVYQAIYGTVPPGMSGLGQFDPTSLLTIAGVVAALGVISAGIYAVIKITNTVSQSLQVKQTQANSYSYAQQQLADAQQRGDAAAAAQWAAVLSQTATAGGGGGSQSIGDWLKSNAGWVVAAGVGLLLAREVL